MSSRYYVVTDTNNPEATRLIRAKTPAQALRYAVRSRYTVEVANQDDLVALLSSGSQAEVADAAEVDDAA